MSFPIASTGAGAALSAVNVNFHGHGHKKGLESATDPTDRPAAQSPAGTTQSLFSSLFDSVEQVVGARTAAITSAGAAAKSVLGTIGSALKLFA